LQHQTGIRLQAIDAPAFRISRQRLIVQCWVVSAETKPEAVLAARRPVAGPGIATFSSQDRHDVMQKTDTLCIFRLGRRRIFREGLVCTAHPDHPNRDIGCEIESAASLEHASTSLNLIQPTKDARRE